MKERLISGIIIVAIVALLLYVGGIFFDIGVGILAVCSFYEFMKSKKDLIVPTLMKIVALICMLLLIYINVDGHTFVFGLNFETISLLFLLILSPTVFLTNHKYKVNDAFYLSAVTLFLGTVFNLFLALYHDSVILFIFIILLSFATDTFAFCGGKLIGKHTFTKISPNKTIEGCLIGSIIGTIIGTTYYSTFILDKPSNIVTITVCIFILTVIGQIGDLFFSLIKRENGIKDFSNLIPGHGGILDRIDSIIFILIAFVFMIRFM
ncbi:MAG: phosphatidate cytidylyltransferase [Erysipelotrichales bacterium]|nr:phosphatidate cytidylyltransferase [Erysipelotrichales bacterium]